MKDIITDAYDKLDAEDEVLIRKIAHRAYDLAKKHRFKADIQTVEMDLTVAHTCCGGLRLSDLLDAKDGDFAHDVWGINRHLNREEFTMVGCFVPRYSK